MKVLLISALFVLASVSALTGIAKTLVAVEAPAASTTLAGVRSTSDPFVLAASLKTTFAP